MSEPLASRYDGIVCDLDGVVYRGHSAVPYAVESLEAVRRIGLRIAYATNNASRPAADVARQLRALGLDLNVSDVVTSSQAGAQHLANELPQDSLVLAVGGEGVALALTEAGLTPCSYQDLDAGTYGAADIAAVLQGLGKDVCWRDFAAAAYAIDAGATWVATNVDSTLPTDRGLAPGNGALVGAVRAVVDREPVVVGKPQPPLYKLSASILGTAVASTLAIGDRLDTDLEGAVNTGMDGLYVMTGVSSVEDVARAGASQRPRYLAADLRALGEPYTEARTELDKQVGIGWCGQAQVRLGEGTVDLTESGTADERLRAVVAAAWAVLDDPIGHGEAGLDGIPFGEVEAWIGRA